MAYNYNNYHYNFSHCLNLLGSPTPGFPVQGAACLTNEDHDVLVMPHSPSAELLGDESIDHEVEEQEAPGKDELISVSVKIIGRNEKRSEHKTFVLRDIDIKRLTISDPWNNRFLTNLEMSLLMKT